MRISSSGIKNIGLILIDEIMIGGNLNLNL